MSSASIRLVGEYLLLVNRQAGVNLPNFNLQTRELCPITELVRQIIRLVDDPQNAP